MAKRGKAAFQFLQFSGVGGLNALVDIGIFNLLILIHHPAGSGALTVYNTISYCAAVFNSYLWNSRLTFRGTATFRRREKIGFILQAGASLLISNGVFLLGLKLTGAAAHWGLAQWLGENLAKVLAMAVSSTASFFFMKYWIFKGPKRPSRS